MIRRFRFPLLPASRVLRALGFSLLIFAFACNSGGGKSPVIGSAPLPGVSADSSSSGRSGPTDASETSIPSTGSRRPDSPSSREPIPKSILFFGNSLTAGYGVKPEEAFPALIGQRVDSLHLSYRVVNAGSSGETSAGGKSRIAWILRQPVDIFVLELGGNDGLRGIPVTATYDNLQAILDSVKNRYPNAKRVLAGMQIPPSMGVRYASDFKALFPKLAAKNKISLIPFILQGVGGVPELNQADGIHPTAKGHRILEENVWMVLKKML